MSGALPTGAALEQVTGQHPVVVRRRVKWGECDPAGVVYTPVFSEYAISGFLLFMESVFGAPLQDKLRELDMLTPMRAMSFDFRRSLYPDQWFDMAVRVREIGTTTFTVDIHFTDDAGGDLLSAAMTVVCVHSSERKSRPLPGRARELLETYRSRCPAPAAEAASSRIAA